MIFPVVLEVMLAYLLLILSLPHFAHAVLPSLNLSDVRNPDLYRHGEYDHITIEISSAYPHVILLEDITCNILTLNYDLFPHLWDNVTSEYYVRLQNVTYKENLETGKYFADGICNATIEFVDMYITFERNDFLGFMRGCKNSNLIFRNVLFFLPWSGVEALSECMSSATNASLSIIDSRSTYTTSADGFGFLSSFASRSRNCSLLVRNLDFPGSDRVFENAFGGFSVSSTVVLENVQFPGAAAFRSCLSRALDGKWYANNITVGNEESFFYFGGVAHNIDAQFHNSSLCGLSQLFYESGDNFVRFENVSYCRLQVGKRAFCFAERVTMVLNHASVDTSVSYERMFGNSKNCSFQAFNLLADNLAFRRMGSSSHSLEVSLESIHLQRRSFELLFEDAINGTLRMSRVKLEPLCAGSFDKALHGSSRMNVNISDIFLIDSSINFMEFGIRTKNSSVRISKVRATSNASDFLSRALAESEGSALIIDDVELQYAPDISFFEVGASSISITFMLTNARLINVSLGDKLLSGAVYGCIQMNRVEASNCTNCFSDNAISSSSVSIAINNSIFIAEKGFDYICEDSDDCHLYMENCSAQSSSDFLSKALIRSNRSSFTWSNSMIFNVVSLFRIAYKSTDTEILFADLVVEGSEGIVFYPFSEVGRFSRNFTFSLSGLYSRSIGDSFRNLAMEADHPVIRLENIHVEGNEASTNRCFSSIASRTVGAIVSLDGLRMLADVNFNGQRRSWRGMGTKAVNGTFLLSNSTLITYRTFMQMGLQSNFSSYVLRDVLVGAEDALRFTGQRMFNCSVQFINCKFNAVRFAQLNSAFSYAEGVTLSVLGSTVEGYLCFFNILGNSLESTVEISSTTFQNGTKAFLKLFLSAIRPKLVVNESTLSSQDSFDKVCDTSVSCSVILHERIEIFGGAFRTMCQESQDCKIRVNDVFVHSSNISEADVAVTAAAFDWMCLRSARCNVEVNNFVANASEFNIFSKALVRSNQSSMITSNAYCLGAGEFFVDLGDYARDVEFIFANTSIIRTFQKSERCQQSFTIGDLYCNFTETPILAPGYSLPVPSAGADLTTISATQGNSTSDFFQAGSQCEHREAFKIFAVEPSYINLFFFTESEVLNVSVVFSMKVQCPPMDASEVTDVDPPPVSSLITVSWGSPEAVTFHNSTTISFALRPPDSFSLTDAGQVNVSVSPKICHGGTDWLGCDQNVEAKGTIELKPFDPPVPGVIRKTVNVLYVTTASTAFLAGNPALIMQQGRMNAVLELSVCSFSHTEALEVSSSPTGIHFGEEKGQYYRGGVIGNFVLMLSGILILYTASAILYLCLRRRKPYRQVLEAMHLPGLVAVPLCMFAQGTASCAMATVVHGVGANDTLIGVSALFAILSGLIFLCTQLTVNFQAELKEVEEETSGVKGGSKEEKRGGPKFFCQRVFEWLLGLSLSQTWDSKRADGVDFVAKYGFVFTDYRKNFHWFYCLEATASVLFIGCLEGVRPKSRSDCNVVIVIFWGVNLTFFVLFTVFRPYIVFLNNAFGVFFAGLTFGASCCICGAQFTGSFTLLSMGEFASTAGLVLGSVKMALDGGLLLLWMIRNSSTLKEKVRRWFQKEELLEEELLALPVEEPPRNVNGESAPVGHDDDLI